MKRAIAIVAAAIACFVLGLWLGGRGRQESGPVSPPTAEAEIQTVLRSQIAALEKERDDLRASQGMAPAAPATPRAAAPAKVSADDPATRQQLVALLNEKNEKIAVSEKQLLDLENRLHQLQEKVGELSEQSQKAAASEKNLQERLDTTVRLTESLQTEMKGREVRLAQAEVSNQELRKKSEEMGRKVSRLAQIGDEMEELSRRRELYLTNILRRYREVTDYFRQATLRQQDSPREYDLSRIQSAVALADEDLRQLNALNAQAGRLQREIKK